MAERPTIFTVGHGARPIEEFLEILRGAGIRTLVDVRTAPGSRKHPQFGRDRLAAALSGAGIEYVWSGDLGGWRKPRAGSPHTALESAGFRGYADHMDTETFRLAIEQLTAAARIRRTAIMCAESLWWRCHRRMVADSLLARGWDVMHLMSVGRTEPHHLHPVARLEGERVVYDRDGPRQEELPG